ERDELQAEVKRLEHANLDLLDEIERLRAPAIRAGLEEEAKRCLEMIRRYVDDEGDTLDSARVLVCVRRALDALADARRAA
ncbi:MAG TPA: hypothetical protein VFP90_04845, partial [Gemmatimonadaceae bacterium]|nr:hypothetical protein [Gemmatimonadaceae bacterium]